MSARKYSRDVPKSVQRAVEVCLELVADERRRRRDAPPAEYDDALDAGEVPGGMPALQQELGYDSPRALRGVVSQAEVAGLLRRAGPVGHGPRRLFLVEARLKQAAPLTCVNCASPVSGTSTHCPTCAPSFRRDRSWRMRAVEMLIAGKSLTAIAAAVSQPLYPARGDSASVGVVAYLLGELPALVPVEWRKGYREVCGAEWSDLSGKVTARARKRKERRRKAPT